MTAQRRGGYIVTRQDTLVSWHRTKSQWGSRLAPAARYSRRDRALDAAAQMAEEIARMVTVQDYLGD